jgi:hypothetical protein
MALQIIGNQVLSWFYYSTRIVARAHVKYNAIPSKKAPSFGHQPNELDLGFDDSPMNI